MVVAAAVAASCGGGESALDAGNDDDAVSDDTATSDDADGEAGTDAGGAASDTDAGRETDGDTDDADGGDDDSGSSEAAESSAVPTTTTAPLAELPPCPLDALDAANGPVEITFWHAMANELETALIAVVDDYNASQDRVRVTLQNQTAYETVIDKYIAGGVDSRPDVVQLPEFIVAQFAQSDTFVPVAACIDAAGFDMGPVIGSVADTYVFEGVQWAMPFNVSSPVYYYNRQMFLAAGLDPDDPPV